MEKFYQEQVERIHRLMKIVEAGDPSKALQKLMGANHQSPLSFTS